MKWHKHIPTKAVRIGAEHRRNALESVKHDLAERTDEPFIFSTTGDRLTIGVRSGDTLIVWDAIILSESEATDAT